MRFLMTTLGVIAILAMWWCAVALASLYLEHREERRKAIARHPAVHLKLNTHDLLEAIDTMLKEIPDDRT